MRRSLAQASPGSGIGRTPDVWAAAVELFGITDWLTEQEHEESSLQQEEVEQAETILKKEGKVVAAHYYPDDGHGFAKRENQIDAMERTVEWFDRYLKSKFQGVSNAKHGSNLLRSPCGGGALEAVHQPQLQR